jgi:hypothetical protein
VRWPSPGSLATPLVLYTYDLQLRQRETEHRGQFSRLWCSRHNRSFVLGNALSDLLCRSAAGSLAMESVVSIR